MNVATPTGALRAWFTVLIVLGSMAVAIAINITYTTLTARRICGLIVLQDDAYRDVPPATETGKRVAAEIHRFRQQNGC